MRISGLNAKSTLLDTDVLPIDNANDSVSQKIAYSDLTTQLRTDLNIGNLVSGNYIQGAKVAEDLELLDTQVYTVSTNSSKIESSLASISAAENTDEDLALSQTTNDSLTTEILVFHELTAEEVVVL